MQVLRVVHVDVCGFAVGEQQQQPLVGRALRQCVSSVAQRGAHACRPAGLQGGKPALCGVVPALGKAFDVQVTHLVAGVGMETGDGKGIVQLFDALRKQGHRFLCQFQQRLFAAGDFLVEGFRQVDQQQHGNAAAVGAVVHVDARIGGDAAPEVDQ